MAAQSVIYTITPAGVMPNLQPCVGNLNSSKGYGTVDPGTTGHFRQVQITLAKAFNVFCRTSQTTDYRFTPEERKSMVYVLAKDGSPLMPTKHHGKVRHLLENGKAVCVRRTPFTIRLLYDTPGRTQPVSLGVDAGSKMVGLSACTEKEELFAAE